MKIVKMDSLNLTVYFSDNTTKQFETAEDYKRFLRAFTVDMPKKKKNKRKK